MKKIILFLVLIQIWSFSNCADKKIENWKIKVRGAIFSTPVVQGNTIYIGTEAGYFYWIDVSTGSVIHEAKVSGPIRSNALVLGQNVFVESCGQLYCFSTETAQEKYKIKPAGENLDMSDYWDYHHNTPVEYQGLVYYAGNLGIIYIVDPEKGAVVKTIKTPEGAPIRSALNFTSNNLYFGDNNGVVYEYNLTNESFTMIHKTVDKSVTYAFITGGPFVSDGKLVFGSRYNTFSVLDMKTKAVAWSRTDKSGSWWSAKPVVFGDKVIIGGSDSYILSALNFYSGEIVWDYKMDYNIFCKPLIVSDRTLIVGTGDSYLNRKGDGSVYSINADSGKRINKYKPGGNVFSSPVENGSNIIICTTTGSIVNISKTFFTNPVPNKIVVEGSFDLVSDNDSSSIVEKQLLINNSGERAALLKYSVKTNGTFPDSLIQINGDQKWIYANGSYNIYLNFNRGDLKPGMYKGEITFSFDDRTETITKSFTVNVKGSAKKSKSPFEVLYYYPDFKDGSVSYKLKVYKNSRIIGLLSLPGSDSIVAFIDPNKLKWGVYRIEKEVFSLDYKSLKPGKYKLVFKSKEHKVEFDYSKE